MDPAGARALHDGASLGWMDLAGAHALHDGTSLDLDRPKDAADV